jgi:hypothetical protein
MKTNAKHANCNRPVASIAVLGALLLLGPMHVAVAGQSGCHAVRFLVEAIPVTDIQFFGTLEGDLEGTILFDFDVFNPFTGVTTANAGNATWNITGGLIPELIGATFTTRFENRNIAIPNTDVFMNIGLHRELEGAPKVNLTYEGEFSFSESVSRLNFKGVLCTP